MPARIALPLSACAPLKAATCATTMSLLHACEDASRHSVAVIAAMRCFMAPPHQTRAKDAPQALRWSTEDFTKDRMIVTIAPMFEQFIGTKPVEERHRIDVAALEKLLHTRIVELE